MKFCGKWMLRCFFVILCFQVQNYFKLFLSYVNLFFFYLGFYSWTPPFTWQQGKGEAISLTPPYIPPASQTLRHWLGVYWRDLTSTRSSQQGSNQKFLVSERKLRTTNQKSPRIAFRLYFLGTADDERLGILYSLTKTDVSMIPLLIIFSVSKNLLGFTSILNFIFGW